MTSLYPAFLETHLLYLTHRLFKHQSKDVLSKLIASATGSVRCQLHVNQTLYEGCPYSLFAVCSVLLDFLCTVEPRYSLEVNIFRTSF